uniref:Uncharacterized protein n=1 Tax=Rhizophora mucronata TaxID=61149 RepID=A0A2P2NN21_RHIMU
MYYSRNEICNSMGIRLSVRLFLSLVSSERSVTNYDQARCYWLWLVFVTEISTY